MFIATHKPTTTLARVMFQGIMPWNEIDILKLMIIKGNLVGDNIISPQNIIILIMSQLSRMLRYFGNPRSYLFIFLLSFGCCFCYVSFCHYYCINLTLQYFHAVQNSFTNMLFPVPVISPPVERDICVVNPWLSSVREVAQPFAVVYSGTTDTIYVLQSTGRLAKPINACTPPRFEGPWRIINNRMGPRDLILIYYENEELITEEHRISYDQNRPKVP